MSHCAVEYEKSAVKTQLLFLRLVLETKKPPKVVRDKKELRRT